MFQAAVRRVQVLRVHQAVRNQVQARFQAAVRRAQTSRVHQAVRNQAQVRFQTVVNQRLIQVVKRAHQLL